VIVLSAEEGKKNDETYRIQDVFSRLDYVDRYLFSADSRKLNSNELFLDLRQERITTDVVYDVLLTEIVYFL
jgi:hypothetical protein